MASIESWRDGTKQMKDIWDDFAYSIGESFLRSTANEMVKSSMRGLGLFGAGEEGATGGGGFASLLSSIGGLLGFANGGSFKVGGAGGTDSQVVAFRATPGEMVDVRTPGQGGGGTTIINNNVNAVDAASFAALTMRNPEAIVSVIQQSVKRGGPLRAVLAGA